MGGGWGEETSVQALSKAQKHTCQHLSCDTLCFTSISHSQSDHQSEVGRLPAEMWHISIWGKINSC